MYNLGSNKIFMDSVHGYINVPKIFVDRIIDTELFQRLRNIDQTGMRMLYPNAKHDRFSHSLGVFYLGNKASNSLLEKFKLETHWNVFDKEEDNEKFWIKNEVLFLLACLLHDIGHTPYSHSLESLIMENSLIKESNRKGAKKISVGDFLKTYIKEKEALFSTSINQSYKRLDADITAAPHEQLGSLLIIKEFKSVINSIIKDLGKALNYDSLQNMSPEEEGDNICFIIRMIMGMKYDDWQIDRQIRNCFIELLNGENFDVDKLDYIIRDTQMSGISNVSVDVERLIGSLCIITKTKRKAKSIEKTSISRLVVTSLENAVGDQISVKGNIHGLIRFNKDTIVEIQKNSHLEYMSGVNFTDAPIAYTSSDLAVFKKESIITTAKGPLGPEKREGFSEEIKLLRGEQTNVQFYVKIEKGEVLNAFKFKALGPVELCLNGVCDIKINGSVTAMGPIKLTNVASINATLSNSEILGDTLKESITSEREYKAFSIGFKKQAINCIASVLDARNYLYLWVYAHHKVIYYANFLIPVISGEISKIVSKKQVEGFPNWNLNYDNIEKLDDYYIWTVAKYFHSQKTVKGELKELYSQLFTRKYYYSLYKSLAEFEMLVDFSLEKIDTIYEKLVNNLKKKGLCVKEKTKGAPRYFAGYLNEKTLEKINAKIKEVEGNIRSEENQENLQIEKMIFVSANYKQKSLITENAYIDMGEEVIPISLLPILAKKAEKKWKNPHYFYLYYKDNVDGGSCDNKKKERNFIIQQAVKEYMKELC